MTFAQFFTFGLTFHFERGANSVRMIIIMQALFPPKGPNRLENSILSLQIIYMGEDWLGFFENICILYFGLAKKLV
jgi:hypothetical protein